jgi:hypothetical protein
MVNSLINIFLTILIFICEIISAFFFGFTLLVLRTPPPVLLLIIYFLSYSMQDPSAFATYCMCDSFDSVDPTNNTNTEHVDNNLMGNNTTFEENVSNEAVDNNVADNDLQNPNSPENSLVADESGEVEEELPNPPNSTPDTPSERKVSRNRCESTEMMLPNMDDTELFEHMRNGLEEHNIHSASTDLSNNISSVDTNLYNPNSPENSSVVDGVEEVMEEPPKPPNSTPDTPSERKVSRNRCESTEMTVPDMDDSEFEKMKNELERHARKTS